MNSKAVMQPKKFSCGRTKTPTINCLGEDIKKDIIKDMSSSLYSLMVDASNDAGLEKMFPISIHIFDVTFNWIMTKLFDMRSIGQQLMENDLCNRS